MKVFISWSGPRSRHVADSLRSWLPKVLQSLRPWMSDEDIAAGARWLPEIAGELSSAQVGVLCVTPENQSNPWLVFEAGALSKTLAQTFVCPMLFGMDPGQLSGPLAQFQAGKFDKTGVSRLIETMNTALGEHALLPADLHEVFEVWWPRLEARLQTIPELEGDRIAPRATSDVLEEILALAREQLRRENLRLEHSQARDERLDRMLPIFDQMVGATKEIQRRGAEVASFLQHNPLPAELTPMLTGALPWSKLDEMMKIMKESAHMSRVETQQLLNPPSEPGAPATDR